MAKKRMQQWKKLVDSHPLIAVQETRGNVMDLLTLDREAPSHLHFLSVIDDRLAGGVLTSFSKKFAEEHFESVFAYLVVEGE